MRSRLVVLIVAVLVVLVLAAGACGDDDGDANRTDISGAVQSCLRESGERLEPDQPIAQQLDLDVDVLAGELVDGGDVIVFVADDAAAAEDAFAVIAQTLGSGADSLDFFREGPVIVLFGEQSRVAQQQLLRECAQQASSG